MTCWMKFLGSVKNYLREYNVTDLEARQILEDIEREVGHNVNLIKSVVDMEKAGLIKRLKRRSKEKKKEEEVAYI
jgi:hypothetical protein